MPKVREASKLNVVWAVDAFTSSLNQQVRAVQALQSLVGNARISIRPTSVLKLGQYDRTHHHFLEKWHEVASAAETQLVRLSDRIDSDSLQEPHLIRQEGSSPTNKAQELIQFALETRADLIALTGRTHTALDRLVMGSFCESLIMQSPLPVFVVPANARLQKRYKNILFPTDFSEASRKAFFRILPIAKSFGLKILLFHKLEQIFPDLGGGIVMPPLSREAVADQVKALKETARAWTFKAEQAGVRVKSHIDIKTASSPLKEIQRMAKKLGPATVIAMASQSGRLSSVLVGSLTRQVLRSATSPILVVHPEQEKLASKFAAEWTELAAAYTKRPVFI